MARRYAHRVDANQKTIVAALRLAGCDVLHTHTLAYGAPDLLVWSPHTGSLHLLELKTEAGKLTEDEQDFHRRWSGPIHVVTTAEEAIAAVTR